MSSLHESVAGAGRMLLPPPLLKNAYGSLSSYFFFLFVCFLNIYLREGVYRWEGRGRGRESPKQIPHLSVEPDMGLDLPILRS